MAERIVAAGFLTNETVFSLTTLPRRLAVMLSELTLAMGQGLGLGRIARTIHPYPTQADAIRRLGDAYNRTRLTPRVRRLFAAWLRWTR